MKMQARYKTQPLNTRHFRSKDTANFSERQRVCAYVNCSAYTHTCNILPGWFMPPACACVATERPGGQIIYTAPTPYGSHCSVCSTCRLSSCDSSMSWCTTFWTNLIHAPM